jgi:hypothetical protein
MEEDKGCDIFLPNVSPADKMAVVEEIADLAIRMREPQVESIEAKLRQLENPTQEERQRMDEMNKIYQVESTPVSIEAPTVGEYIPRNRAEKRARARPRKGGVGPGFRQMPAPPLDSILRMRR